MKVPKSFFERKTLVVAKDLIGKFLVRNLNGEKKRFIITEVEAYVGENDLACHASKGKTPRTITLFDEAGIWYVYFTYGMHWLLNIVTEEGGFPVAVLIRGVCEIKNGKIVNIFDGPAKLTKVLGIDGKLNGKKAGYQSGLWFEDQGVKIPAKLIKRTPRIGVDYAGPIWSKKPWRFFAPISSLVPVFDRLQSSSKNKEDRSIKPQR